MIVDMGCPSYCCVAPSSTGSIGTGFLVGTNLFVQYGSMTLVMSDQLSHTPFLSSAKPPQSRGTRSTHRLSWFEWFDRVIPTGRRRSCQAWLSSSAQEGHQVPNRPPERAQRKSPRGILRPRVKSCRKVESMLSRCYLQLARQSDEAPSYFWMALNKELDLKDDALHPRYQD
jgi:hypothetical protein